MFTRDCGSEFIRKSFIPDAANVLDVLASSRMNPTDPTICTRYCGSEFIRESFIPDAANVLDVLAPSRMNSPQFSNDHSPKNNIILRARRP
jgi:hypothetical protein